MNQPDVVVAGGESVGRDFGQECDGGNHTGEPEEAGIPSDERNSERSLSL